jgi:hypothetical protein
MSRNAVFGAPIVARRAAKVCKRIAATLALLLVCTDAAYADTAVAWTFEVLEVARITRDSALIRLRPRPPGRKFPRSCETLVVNAYFDLESWNPSARRVVTREGHERSLRLLQQAQITGDIVRFGAVGHGFGAVAEAQRCEVASRGLQIIVDDDGTPVVYSVFKEPSVGPPRP